MYGNASRAAAFRFGLNCSHSCATNTRYRTLIEHAHADQFAIPMPLLFSHTYTRTYQLLTSLASAPKGGLRIDSTHIQEKLMGTQTRNEVLDATT